MLKILYRHNPIVISQKFQGFLCISIPQYKFGVMIMYSVTSQTKANTGYNRQLKQINLGENC